MAKTIHLAAKLALPLEDAFDAYLNPTLHAQITGAPVVIAPRAGAEFRAFDGALEGTILQVMPKRLIVQSWRSSGWKATDIDSTLILTFLPQGRRSTVIELVHVNVPDHDFAGVSHGWEHYYWAPWREYLKSRGGGGGGAKLPRKRQM
jgi:uncharacterized protein YndB with AHSA1/START domain